MRVVLCDYGAGNLRSVSAAFARAGATPVVSTDPRRGARGAARGDRGRRSRRERRPRPSAGRRRAARARRKGAARRSASVSGCSCCSRRARRAAAGSACCPGPCGGSARGECRTWAGTRSRCHGPVRRPRRPRRRRRLLRPQLCAGAADGARRRRGASTTGRSSPPSSMAPSPASSSIPSEAAPPAHACSRTCCDGQEARDPVPRRGRRARRQGRPLRVAARRRRPGRAGRAVLRARRRRDRVPRHHGDRRRARAHARASSSGRPSRSRCRSRSAAAISGLEDARSLLRAGADKIAVNRAAVDEPGAAVLARRRVRRAGGRLRDRRPCGRGRHAWWAASRAGSRRREWARRGGRAAGAGELLVTSIDADGTRDGYDLALTRRSPTRSRCRSSRPAAPARARHLAEAFEAGAEAALVASIVHERPERLRELKLELEEAGWNVRI